MKYSYNGRKSFLRTPCTSSSSSKECKCLADILSDARVENEFSQLADRLNKKKINFFLSKSRSTVSMYLSSLQISVIRLYTIASFLFCLEFSRHFEKFGQRLRQAQIFLYLRLEIQFDISSFFHIVQQKRTYKKHAPIIIVNLVVGTRYLLYRTGTYNVA